VFEPIAITFTKGNEGTYHECELTP